MSLRNLHSFIKIVAASIKLITKLRLKFTFCFRQRLLMSPRQVLQAMQALFQKIVLVHCIINPVLQS
jgi:hypothetical protein